MGRFWVFLSHSAPGFQLWFYSHLYMWVIHWGLLLRLPWRAWVCSCEGHVGGGATAWVTGVLAAPGTQRSWQLGQQEILCSRRVWQPVLANTLQYSCLETPPPPPLLPDREAWQTTVYRDAESATTQVTHTRLFLACGSSAPVRVECEGGTAAWLLGTLAVPSV